MGAEDIVETLVLMEGRNKPRETVDCPRRKVGYMI